MGLILIDSSSKDIEFSYADGSGITFRKKLEPEYNADMLIYFIKTAFDEEGVGFKEIEFVSLSNGPGSFTGLRIGSAIAKGICFGVGSTLIAISTLDILANSHKSENKTIPLISSNSKTKEFYFAEYIFKDLKLKRISEYQIELLSNILEENEGVYVFRGDSELISSDLGSKLINKSGISSMDSQYELTIERIEENSLDNYKTSEPFYMNEFIPKI